MKALALVGCALLLPLEAHAGATLTPLLTFDGWTAGHAEGGLVEGPNGVLYGTTAYAGKSDWGVVFSLTPPSTSGGNWTLTDLYSYSGVTAGTRPVGTPAIDSSGDLYVVDSSQRLIQLAPAPAGSQWTATTIAPRVANQVISDKNGNIYTVDVDQSEDFINFVKYDSPSSPGDLPSSNSLCNLGEYEGSLDIYIVSDNTGGFYITNLNDILHAVPPTTSGGTWSCPVVYEVSDTGGLSFNSPVVDAFGNIWSIYNTSSSSNLFEISPPATAGANWNGVVVATFPGVVTGFTIARSGSI